MTGFDFSLLTRGGPMMYVVLLMAVIGAVLFVERTLFLHRSQIRSTAFVDGVKNILAKRRLVEALTVCEETPGPVAAVVKAALLNAGEDEVRMRYSVQEAALIEIPVLERRLGFIAAIAQVAPMVGILGTILGMISTFGVFMHGPQYAPAQTLAGGMWQALIAAAGSLMVGIPAHLAYHFLNGRVRALIRDVEWAANEMMRHLLTDYRKGDKTEGEPRSPQGS